MGLFNRFQKVAVSSSATGALGAGDADKKADELLALGQALEQQGRPEEALLRYDEAIQLAPQPARAHFSRGIVLLELGRAQAAVEAFLSAINFKPDSAGAHFNLGNAYVALERYDAAAESYERVITLRPDFADALFALGSVREGRGELDAAELCYRRALQINPDYAEVLCNLGDVLGKLGKFDEAEVCYGRAFRIDPGNADFCFKHGVALHDLEQHALAELRYLATLKLQPDHAQACNNLGALLTLQKRMSEAASFYQRALSVNPDSAETLANLGAVQQDMKQLDEAAASYRRAIAVNSTYIGAHLGLAKVLRVSGEVDEAARCVRRALEINPENAEAHLELGLAMHLLKRYEESISCYSSALKFKPDYAEAHNNLGASYSKLEETDLALQHFQKAVDLKPEFAEAHNNLGSMLLVSKKYAEAAKSIERALTLEPDFAEAHLNYGSVWEKTERYDLAENEYRRASELKPTLAEAYANLGSVLKKTRRFTESLASFRHALELKPEFVLGMVNLSHTLKDVLEIDEAIELLRRALALEPKNMTAHHNLLFDQYYLAQPPARQMLADAKRFGQLASSKAKRYTSWPNSPDPDRSLRIGLVSGDLGHHPVGFFLLGVLNALSTRASERLEVIAYPNRPCDDRISKQIQAHCAGWHSAMGLSDQALSERIRDDEIDILIDLSGHSGETRLPVFAWKPAPVQVTWLGYFGTTGVAEIDYIIADPWTMLDEEEQFFSEQVWRLPETRLCFSPPDIAVDVNALPALSNGYVTFSCFNNLTKMNDAVVATWVRVLKAVPGSRLFIKSQLVAEPAMREKIIDKFTSRGIEGERLLLEDFESREDYMRAYHRVDISLDPFPFPGGTTTVESLWMGVPVLTLSGANFLPRQGVGLLANAGLEQWIASDPDDYVARAVASASDIQSLAALRARLRDQVLRSPIYDADRFAGHFEDAMRAMWRNWCKQGRALSSSA